jgi:hypothetical protein
VSAFTVKSAERRRPVDEDPVVRPADAVERPRAADHAVAETSSTSAPDSSMATAPAEAVDHVRDDDVPIGTPSTSAPYIDRSTVDLSIAEAARCVSLGIEVDDEDPSSREG